MAKDQLGWEQILNGSSPGEAKSELPPDPLSDPLSGPVIGAEPATESPIATARRKPALKDRPRSEKSASRTVRASSDAVQYAKKDWGRLDLGAPVVASLVKEPVTPAEPAVIAKIESTVVAVTVPEPVPASVVSSPIEINSEPEVLSISELNRSIREILEGRFPLLWLKGEISNFKAHTSGHFYLSLKDAKAQISAVMFRGFNSHLRFRPEDGMEVLVRGKVTVYEPRGNYQIFIEQMEPVGAGALQKAYEQLKARLQAEGLFDLNRKRPLPALPRHIAIVTSPTGAAIRDMLNVLSRRFKGVKITLVPCKVQGDAAPREICAAIELANRLPDVDVMIVGRGGGSIEDLWAFNDERVARAIVASRVPVISAVGHEVDVTIADFVADLRAPTPSAAAELVVKNAADLLERVVGLSRSLRSAMLRHLQRTRQGTTMLARRLVDPQRRIQDASLRCDELLQRLQASGLRSLRTRRLEVQPLRQQLRSSMRNSLSRKREHFIRLTSVLDSLSPLRVLDRGYSMVVVEGQVVSTARELKVDQDVKVRMAHGSIRARVTEVKLEQN